MSVKVNIWPFFDLVWPVCAACGLPAGGGSALCTACRGDLPRIDRPCPRCVLPLAADAPAALPCPRCRGELPVIGRMVAATAYAFPVDRLVQQLKFGGRLPLANTLGGLLAERVREGYVGELLPRALIPVPLHRKRLRERGFNQAGRIAHAVARQLGNLPVLEGQVARTRHTPAQSVLELRLRRHNLEGAFMVNAALPPHVAIVDDVVTSGSTVLALAKALRAAGVARVDAWTVCRTL